MKFPLKNQIGIAIAIIVVAFLLFNPIVTIESGEVGILKTWGKFSPDEQMPGIHFVFPGMQRIQKVDVRVHTINYSRSERTERPGILNRPPIQVLDQRGLPIIIEQTVQFRLIKDRASETVARWGTEWDIKIINPTVREVVRDVVGSFPAELIPIKRQEIALGIAEKVKERIKTISENSIEIVGVQLRNVELPPEIAQKIKEVQVAKQEAEKTVYLEERAVRVQKVKLIEAETEKLEKIKRAEGEAQKSIKEAEGVAQANRLIQKSISPEVIRWKNLDVQMRVAESLKSNQNATVFLNTPAATGLHMWLEKK